MDPDKGLLFFFNNASGFYKDHWRKKWSTKKKVAPITLAFWAMKICATTLGETAGDLMSMMLGVGYGWNSVILNGFFLIVLAAQLFSKAYFPSHYWSVIIATSTAGTTMSDFMDRSLGLGYATGSLILFKQDS